MYFLRIRRAAPNTLANPNARNVAASLSAPLRLLFHHFLQPLLCRTAYCGSLARIAKLTKCPYQNQMESYNKVADELDGALQTGNDVRRDGRRLWLERWEMSSCQPPRVPDWRPSAHPCRKLHPIGTRHQHFLRHPPVVHFISRSPDTR